MLIILEGLADSSCQQYFTFFPSIYEIELEQGSCTSDEVSTFCCPANLLDGITITPDSELIILGDDWMDNDYLWLVNQTSGEWTSYFALPPSTGRYIGLVSVGNGIFYTAHSVSNILFELDVNNGTYEELGPLSYPNDDMALFNGEIYFIWREWVTPYRLRGIRKLDVSDPSNSELIVDLTYLDIGLQSQVRGLTASNICNTMIICNQDVSLNSELLYVNLIDAVVTPACELEQLARFVTSSLEFEPTTICEVYLDLDHDDSSGEDEADYLGDEFTCLSNAVNISDHDITTLYDALIMEMTVEIVGFIPDAPNEILQIAGSVPNIDIAGNGT